MNHKNFKLFFSVAAAILSFLMTVPAQTFAPKPSVFGEGVVSSKDFEFNASFTPDGKTVFFSKSLLPDWRRISIVSSTYNGKTWNQPKLASFSGQYRDADPYITPDGNKLIFISDRPSPIQKKQTDYHFWYVEKTARGWSEAKHLSGDFYQVTPNPVYPSIARNGNLYYSASDGKDSEIYVVKQQNGRYGMPEKLSLNSPAHRDIDPIIAPDESFIIFTNFSRKGVGGNDLWVSFNKDGKWSEPVNLGNSINTPGNEGQPGLSPDGTKLYFTSTQNKEKTDYAPRTSAISQADFEKELNGIFNGLPNIWEVDISQIKNLLGNNGILAN